jgi:hypothetical protein
LGSDFPSLRASVADPSSLPNRPELHSFPWPEAPTGNIQELSKATPLPVHPHSWRACLVPYPSSASKKSRFTVFRVSTHFDCRGWKGAAGRPNALVRILGHKGFDQASRLAINRHYSDESLHCQRSWSLVIARLDRGISVAVGNRGNLTHRDQILWPFSRPACCTLVRSPASRTRCTR